MTEPEDAADAGTTDTGVDAGAPAGAPCGVQACAEGECLHGVCSPFCLTDPDCDDGLQEQGLLCVGRGGARRCTRACTSVEMCLAGEICAVEGPGRGFCVAPGAQTGGEPCVTRDECSSWFCLSGRCLDPCDVTACDDDQTCLTLHTQAVCAPRGEGPPRAPCVTGADCQSAVCRGGDCTAGCAQTGLCPDDRVCVEYQPLSLCERPCADATDCGPRAFCESRICVTRGVTEPGEACNSDAVCQSARCINGACAAPCDPNCANGSACVQDFAGGTCRPAGVGARAAPCNANADCDSAICAAGRCSVACLMGECDANERCVEFTTGPVCHLECAAHADCAESAYCDADLGVCLERGEAREGAVCEDDRDCQSARCEPAQMPGASGRCAQDCPLGDCDAGQACLDFVAGPYCAATPRPFGAECEADDDCDERRCVGGRCGTPCANDCPSDWVCHDSVCRPPCQTGDDCRAGRNCVPFDGADRFCANRGTARVGTACAVGADCVSGFCFDGRCRGRCANGACGPADRCLVLADVPWCVPAGEVPLGGPCGVENPCLSGLCVGGRCAAQCGDGCAAGTICRALRGGEFCLPTCDRFGAACADPEVCEFKALERLGRCVTRAGGDVDTECTRDADCGPHTAGCRGGRCRLPCDLAAPVCQEAQACAPAGPNDVLGGCVPAGAGATMASCDAGADCASGWCILDDLGGRCGRSCLPGCPAGEGCVDLARNPRNPFQTCAPACPEVGCTAPSECRQPLVGEARCY